MKYGIIAAGEGSRLTQEGVKIPKPLVSVKGMPLIERLIGIFVRNNAESISIIINSHQPQTKAFLEELQKSHPIDIVVKDTPSSMHSMYALSEHLKGGKFCLTTVDTIFNEEEFKMYIKEFSKTECNGVMAVTDYIDDEKPLYVSTDESLYITGFHDYAPVNARYISGGIYALDDRALETLSTCIANGSSRMRNFQRQLIADGLSLKAYPFGKIIDVDHVEDIEKAEELISQQWK